MSINDLRKKCDSGCDVTFNCLGKRFTIMSYDEEIIIAEQITEDHMESFDSVDELLEKYMINGVPLHDLWDQVVVTSVN